MIYDYDEVVQIVNRKSSITMIITHDLSQPINDLPTALTIGVFDGVHRGHQHLIGATVQRARDLGMQSAVLTFDPHPDLITRPERKRLYLSSFERRAELVAQLGADVLIVMPFTHETKALGARDFMQRITHMLALRELWVGYDFALGRKREGNLERLSDIGSEFGYTVHPVAAFVEHDQPLSSSGIRAALAEGQVEAAAAMLGHPFSVDGMVVHGDQRGRTIGFPTANVDVSDLQFLPADGVYVCQVTFSNKRFGAVTNVGMRPTFDGLRRTVEAHLLDFSGDIYNQQVRVDFLHRLRGEQKFNGVQELIAQITRDAQAARDWLQAQQN